MKAHVDSLDVLKSFRVALWKFQETSMAALAEAESEVHRTLVWLETEQLIFWENQIRKRHDWVEKCKEAFRQKTIYKDAAGHRSSGFDERKALEKAKKALEEAEEKYQCVKRYVRVLQKELQNFTGSLQRFATDVMTNLPNTAAQVETMQRQLEEYVNLSVPQEMGSIATVSADASMARGDSAKAEQTPSQQWPAPQNRHGPLVETANFLLTQTPLTGPHRLTIAMMKVKRVVPEPIQWVTISADLKRPEDVYLHRANPTEAADSGWYVSAVHQEQRGNENIRITVEKLLEVRPDWREMLSLPIDFVVVMAAGSIANVYNEKGEDMWKGKRS
jgi:hypothetical protein